MLESQAVAYVDPIPLEFKKVLNVVQIIQYELIKDIPLSMQKDVPPERSQLC